MMEYNDFHLDKTAYSSASMGEGGMWKAYMH